MIAASAALPPVRSSASLIRAGVYRGGSRRHPQTPRRPLEARVRDQPPKPTNPSAQARRLMIRSPRLSSTTLVIVVAISRLDTPPIGQLPASTANQRSIFALRFATRRLQRAARALHLTQSLRFSPRPAIDAGTLTAQ